MVTLFNFNHNYAIMFRFGSQYYSTNRGYKTECHVFVTCLFDGAVLTGINSLGTYEISKDGKEITFKEEARDESYSGTLDEEFIQHYLS